MIRRPRRLPSFPYTTLFRSPEADGRQPQGPGARFPPAGEGRRARPAALQDGRRYVARGLPDRPDHLHPLRPASEPAADGPADPPLHPDHGHPHDLPDHAAHDPPLLLLALPGRLSPQGPGVGRLTQPFEVTEGVLDPY